MTTIETRSWTSPRGDVRQYVHNLGEILGVEVDRYRSGNVSAAWRNGEKISNSEANRILGMRVWLDTEGEVHVDRRPATDSAYVTDEEIVAAIEALR